MFVTNNHNHNNSHGIDKTETVHTHTRTKAVLNRLSRAIGHLESMLNFSRIYLLKMLLPNVQNFIGFYRQYIGVVFLQIKYVIGDKGIIFTSFVLKFQ